MRKVITSIILIVMILMLSMSNVYAAKYSSDGMFVPNTVEQLNKYLKEEGYPHEYTPTKVGGDKLTWETQDKTVVVITKAKDEYGYYYVIEIASKSLGRLKLGQEETENGVVRGVDVPTTLQQVNERVAETFATNGSEVFDWQNNLIEGINTFRWQKEATISINSLEENGKATFTMNVKEKVIDLVQEPKYSNVEAPDESSSIPIGETRWVIPGGTYRFKYNAETKQIEKSGIYPGGQEIEIKNKFSWNGEEWCSTDLGYYVKASGIQPTKPTEEELKNASGIDDPKELENGYDWLGGEEDYFYFEDGWGGVWMEDLGGSTIADPTNEASVNEYNPYNSGSALTEANSSKILNIGKTVIGILNVIATVVAVLVLTILGIKYMMGSIEEKAEYKETMMPYIVGAIFIFSSTTIVNLLYNFAMTFNK